MIIKFLIFAMLGTPLSLAQGERGENTGQSLRNAGGAVIGQGLSVPLNVSSDNSKSIRGLVLMNGDELAPIKMAKISVRIPKGKQIAKGNTNLDGVFVLALPEMYLTSGALTLQASKKGYSCTPIKITRKDLNGDVRVSCKRHRKKKSP